MNLTDLKKHLNITTDEDDALLTQKLDAATAFIGEFVIDGALDNASVQEAILQLAAHFYENREATTPGSLREAPFGVWDLLAPFRSYAL